jgi:hypothetical protein
LIRQIRAVGRRRYLRFTDEHRTCALGRAIEERLAPDWAAAEGFVDQFERPQLLACEIADELSDTSLRFERSYAERLRPSGQALTVTTRGS